MFYAMANIACCIYHFVVYLLENSDEECPKDSRQSIKRAEGGSMGVGVIRRATWLE